MRKLCSTETWFLSLLCTFFLFLFACSGEEAAQVQDEVTNDTTDSASSSGRPPNLDWSAEECDFVIEDATNGPDLEGQTSQWDCTGPDEEEFTFSAFEDGTGFSPQLGSFEWDATQNCGEFELTTGVISETIRNCQGSRDQGTFTFQASLGLGPDISLSCVLNAAPFVTVESF